ncbi:MAG: hypothetical protein ACK45H_09210 [Bacteroidota bacterium]|jgi:hypothetical protein
MILSRYCFSILVVFAFVGCTYDPLEVDASSVKVKIGFINADSLLTNGDAQELIELHQRFLRDIPEIWEYELGYCLGIGNVSDTAFRNSYTKFTADEYVARVQKRIAEKFADLSLKRKEITNGFRHLVYHFPKGKVPENIVFLNSFYASSAFCTQTEIGIGLERYLGKETDVIQELPSDQFYEWMKEGLDERYMSRDALCSWIMTHYIEEIDGNLAEHMIRWGKILYLTEAAFPDVNESIILRYSEDEVKWAIDHEYDIWKYLVQDKLLFKNDERLRINMLNDAPFTVGLPEKGPDRLGQFIGWRMVHKYMEIKRIGVDELVKTPYTAILAEYEID